LTKTVSTEKPYIKAIDNLRTISILAVILIHTTTRTIETTHNDLINFPVSLFLNQIARFAVPLFILISGFVLELSYNYHLSFWSYLKKRISRILLPYLIWSLIYYYFVYTQNHDNLIWVLATGNASYQLYFIPALAIFYAVFPVLHKLYKVISNKFIYASLGILQLWLLYQDYFIKEYKFPDPLRITILSFFFFITGMVVSRNKDKIIEFVNKWKYYLATFALGLGFYVFREGQVDFLNTTNYLSFYSQWRPSILFYTLAIFLILFYAFDKSHLQFKLSERFAKLSYLVFFIHVIVLELVWKVFGYKLFNIIGGDVFGKSIFDPIFFATVAAISFGIAYLIHKIPNLSKLTG
jgi:probable poly-beta-1,6-N-acetyl-D-glucosamine export protein